jgi:hypothetical protein
MVYQLESGNKWTSYSSHYIGAQSNLAQCIVFCVCKLLMTLDNVLASDLLAVSALRAARESFLTSQRSAQQVQISKS